MTIPDRLRALRGEACECKLKRVPAMSPSSVVSLSGQHYAIDHCPKHQAVDDLALTVAELYEALERRSRMVHSFTQWTDGGAHDQAWEDCSRTPCADDHKALTTVQQRLEKI